MRDSVVVSNCPDPRAKIWGSPVLEVHFRRSAFSPVPPPSTFNQPRYFGPHTGRTYQPTFHNLLVLPRHPIVASPSSLFPPRSACFLLLSRAPTPTANYITCRTGLPSRVCPRPLRHHLSFSLSGRCRAHRPQPTLGALHANITSHSPTTIVGRVRIASDHHDRSGAGDDVARHSSD